MAQIKGLKEMQSALKEISKKVKSLAPINEFLEADNPSGVYNISFGEYSAPLHCSDEDKELIQALVLATKQRIVSDIRAEAERHSIEFDENEEALLK